ncbi:cupredoxin domain-containing protein [Noviherbaspirillum denitrificans]|uniref:Blue (type 1) copper domain-containing protein n=1 Tax=Noviherbaspirillum denitrificans TaxID=1968433 RepID=A0A254TJ34_9BURK|nr:cupredoxin family protein [Noviherbaspirillum denitrificans]OWW22636.1 hypothetical protein AYR66_27180 [Noviherbaspirillum denitrificans]
MRAIHTTSATAFTPFVLALGLVATNASAGPGHAHGGHETTSQGQEFGKPGDTNKISRVVSVDMNDLMRFGPSDIAVKQGETIRFVVSNKGKLVHEMVLGTMDELKAHGASMQMTPDAAHDDPSAARVDPGQKKALVWQFTKVGDVFYACLIPGHFEAGMVGKIKVLKG